MTVKEKLVDLLDTSPDIRMPYTPTEIVADRLIAHGVTVQELDECDFCANAKWISGEVTASHPHNDGIVCNQIDGDFNFCPMCGRKLPQPPKGE